jgi:hypothetical protein
MIARAVMLAGLAAVLTIPAHLSAGRPTNRTIVLATGHTLRDSGLLDVLIPVLEKTTGYVVRPIAVGTGQALAMGKRGDADVLLTHDPEAEAPLVKEGYLISRRQFMHNEGESRGGPRLQRFPRLGGGTRFDQGFWQGPVWSAAVLPGSGQMTGDLLRWN